MKPTGSGGGRPARSTVRGKLAPVAAVLVLTGCAGQLAVYFPAEPANASRSAVAEQASGGRPTTILPAREGRPAKSTRVRFIPESLTLSGGARAEVAPAETVNGELEVPENVSHVGWWDGSSYAGDPFGSTVIAGHVDSATGGIGFFARLLRIRVGSRVTLRGDGHAATYQIVSVQRVAKHALASGSRAFDQRGPHRLVLITCTGRYDPQRGGYDSNLVVTGRPLGLAR